MKKKYKIKKKVLYSGLIFIGIIFIAIFLSLKIYNNYKYKQSYEYKLIEHGYTLEQAKELEKNSKEKDLNQILKLSRNENIITFLKEKYYITNNLERYLNYQDKNKDTSTKDIVAIVNVNRDFDYYKHDIDSDISKNELLLVNKYYKLKEDFEPINLVNISNKYAYQNNQVISIVNDAFVSMWNAANENGYKLIINSSYRSYKSQDDVYNNLKASKGEKNADKQAARPGYSEHQTGLAIDVFEINNQLTSTFKDSEAYTWLKNNAYLYGFIERYPEDKENITGYAFESWHYRYVGIEVAKIIHDEDITYDEYYAYYIENQANN